MKTGVYDDRVVPVEVVDELRYALKTNTESR